MSDVVLTTRTLRFCSLRLGDPWVSDHDGLTVPVSVNGDGPLLVTIPEADHLSCLPHVELVNGVRYDVAWWYATTGGNPHIPVTKTGYRCRSIRVQRVGSDLQYDRTEAAFALACRLIPRIVDAVTGDADVMRQAAIVAAEREVIARQITYDRALADLHKAETALRTAEDAWDRLSAGDALAIAEPGESLAAIEAGLERRTA